MQKVHYLVARLLTSMAMLLGILVLAAPVAMADENAYIRFLHAAPKLNNIDVFIDGKAYRQNFAFAGISDNYKYDTYASGSHTVQIAAAGEGVDKAVVKQTVTFEANAAYTLAVVGAGNENPELLSFTDDNTILQPGAAKTRLYDFCSDCGSLNASLSNIPQPVTGITYKSATDYLYVPAGHYTITGTLPTGQQVPFEIDLAANQISSAFVVGLLQNTGAQKLQLVGARVVPTPGLPNTGSDPNAPKVQSSLPWLPSVLIAGAVVLGIGGTGIFFLRRSRRIAQTQ